MREVTPKPNTIIKLCWCCYIPCHSMLTPQIMMAFGYASYMLAQTTVPCSDMQLLRAKASCLQILYIVICDILADALMLM